MALISHNCSQLYGQFPSQAQTSASTSTSTYWPPYRGPNTNLGGEVPYSGSHLVVSALFIEKKIRVHMKVRLTGK